MDLTVKMEFSANVPADTQAYALVISDRMLKFKSDGSKMERAMEMEDGGEVVVVRTLDSSTIVVSAGSASVQTVFTPPLHSTPLSEEWTRLWAGNGESGNLLFICKYSN